ncbi:unnamed protein product [Heterosigma akashiwo]
MVRGAPEYQVINPSPSFGQVVSNFGLKEIAALGAFPAAWAHYVFITGKPRYYRAGATWTAGIFGAAAGLCYAYQSSWGRLAGYSDNGLKKES